MLKRFVDIYWRHIASPIKYAKHIGVEIGTNCMIATRGWSTEPYLIKVGNNVQITRGVSIHTHGGCHCIRHTHPDFDCFGKVVIEDWCYIGAFSQICPGVTIGEGSLVAAGSIVTKSVPPHSVVGGNPAKYICSTEDFFKRNMCLNVNTKKLNSIEKKDFLLSLEESKFIKK